MMSDYAKQELADMFAGRPTNDAKVAFIRGYEAGVVAIDFETKSGRTWSDAEKQQWRSARLASWSTEHEDTRRHANSIWDPSQSQEPLQSAPEPDTGDPKLREWDDIATSLEKSISKLSNMMVDKAHEDTAEGELKKIATMVGEPDDPYAAWETITGVYGLLAEVYQLVRMRPTEPVTKTMLYRIEVALARYEDPL
jgi:hypothetical protein